ncbi:MAG: hypothetical protein K2Z80_29565 [Xanthobacteraceae bacterium]|nr:hypothetical protein [Xanthobacteraceae bacterium]
MRLLVIVTAVVGIAAAAQAQTTPPSDAPPPAGGAPSPSTPSPSTPSAGTPPVDCRAQAQSKGLRGQAARDALEICMAEQRLACIKGAVEKKVIGAARRDFILSCAGRPGRADAGNKG